MWRLDARAHSGTHTWINSTKFPRTWPLSAPSFLLHPHSNTDPKTHHISDLVTVSGRYRGKQEQCGAGTVAVEMLDIQIPVDSCRARFPYIFFTLLNHTWNMFLCFRVKFSADSELSLKREDLFTSETFLAINSRTKPVYPQDHLVADLQNETFLHCISYDDVIFPWVR